MDNEKNNIRKINRKLPKHAAPDSVWESLEGKFRQEEKFAGNLQKAISLMPGYSPPEKTWKAIEKGLSKRGFFVLMFFKTDMWLKIAAILIIVLAIAFMLKDKYSQQNNIQNTIAVNSPEITENVQNAGIIIDEIISEIKEAKNEPKKNIAQKSRNNNRKQEVQQQLVDKGKLAIIHPVKVSKLVEEQISSELIIPEIQNREVAKPDNQAKIVNVKLIVHNDKAKPKEINRFITFSLFKPVSYSRHRKDTTKRNAKPMFAASINL
ncbi:MAG: hypothetical protein U9R19_00470 [Bacteroidota bacterium]|nr:hypothetical protein [Bacteroidota bacterium]